MYIEKKVVRIIGLIGENLGDEALGVAAYRQILKSNDLLELELAELIDGKLQRHGIAESFIVDRKSIRGIFSLIRKIKSSDVIVVGGGSLIQDRLGISLLRGTLPFLFQVVFLSYIFRKKIFSLPIGIDKLDTMLGRCMAFFVLKMIDRVRVRDELSLYNAVEYGGRSMLKKVSVVPDPAFAFEESSHIPIEGEYIVISLAKEVYDLQIMVKAIEKLHSLLKDQGYKLVLLSMDERPSEEFLVNKMVAEKIGDPNVIVFPLGRSIADVAGLLRRAKIVVAMRLHAAILAYGYTNVFMVSRTTKTEAFIEKYDVSGCLLHDLLSENEVVDGIVEAMKKEVKLDSNRAMLASIRKQIQSDFRDLYGAC